MKILETLTQAQQIALLSGEEVGIFSSLIKSTDKWYKDAGKICQGYYLYRSGNKTLSPFYTKTIELSSSTTIKPENVVGEYIRAKFIDKWDKIYNALFVETYNPIDEFVFNETKTGNNVNTITYGSKENKTGNNTDNTTYNTTIKDNGKKATNETVNRKNDVQEDTYGFNSTSPVNTDGSNETVTETTIGEADKNTTENTSVKTGTDNKTFGINEETAKSGNDKNSKVIDETISRNGRENSGAKLIEEELKLRNKNIFFDIIYSDIDSIITLQIYL